MTFCPMTLCQIPVDSMSHRFARAVYVCDACNKQMCTACVAGTWPDPKQSIDPSTNEARVLTYCSGCLTPTTAPQPIGATP